MDTLKDAFLAWPRSLFRLWVRINEELGKVTIDNGWKYLQLYCVAEIIFLSFLCTIVVIWGTFIMDNFRELKELSDLQFGGTLAAPGMAWPLINKVWDNMSGKMDRFHVEISKMEIINDANH